MEATPHLSSRVTLSSRKIYLEKNLSANHKFWVIAASTSDELYAAATLRAQIFYSYPPQADAQLEGIEAVKARVAHDYHLVDLLRTRVKSEFNRVCDHSLLVTSHYCELFFNDALSERERERER